MDASVDHHTGGRAKEAARTGKLGGPGGEASSLLRPAGKSPRAFSCSFEFLFI